MRHARRAGLMLALTGTFLLGGFVLPSVESRAGAKLFQEVFTLVSNRYEETLDNSELYERAARGLLEKLEDPYAQLFSPSEMEQFTTRYEGHYGGVGMLVEDQNGAIVVGRVFPNTPAEKAGVRVGDRIVALDEQATRGWALSQVADGLKGRPGSDVRVQFQRPGVAEPIAVRLRRAVIRIPAVPYATMLESGMGYIPLLQFNETAAQEVSASARRLVAEGARGLVLDLRGNGGGLVSDAVEIAGLFLPRNALIAEQRERGQSTQRYVSRSSPLVPTLPLVVLVDGGSASASEIVAGALQDHDRAVVIGSPTFGKGLVQSVYRLDGGYVLKMTTGKWYTPAGRTIHLERPVVAGRLVRERADTLPPDTARASRPQYQSAGGRTIYGGGGILPDLIVRLDTLTAAEQALSKLIVPHSQDVYTTLFDYAFELKSTVAPDFRVLPEWRAELYRRLVVAGVTLDTAAYEAGSTYVDRLLSDRIARLAFGEAVARQRSVSDDAVLSRGLELLQHAATQADLITRLGALHH
jgi:carboxyl-terminal processing protease